MTSSRHRSVAEVVAIVRSSCLVGAVMGPTPSAESTIRSIAGTVPTRNGDHCPA